MMTAIRGEITDKPHFKTSVHLTIRESIYSIRAISKLFRIRNEGFMVLFAVTDSYYVNNKPITVYGICKALCLPPNNSHSTYMIVENLIKKGLVEVVSMGNVHKYYIPTDKALEQISPLLR